jgi:hypothetical protein
MNLKLNVRRGTSLSVASFNISLLTIVNLLLRNITSLIIWSTLACHTLFPSSLKNPKDYTQVSVVRIAVSVCWSVPLCLVKVIALKCSLNKPASSKRSPPPMFAANSAQTTPYTHVGRVCCSLPLPT